MGQEKSMSMKIVKEETGLSSRQIRYYDKMGLIFPGRSEGNQRLFSEQDIARLKKIKALLNEGYNISAIKEKLEEKPADDSVISEVTHDFGKKGKTLTSLYPVSDRSYLTRMLDKEEKENKEES